MGRLPVAEWPTRLHKCKGIERHDTPNTPLPKKSYGQLRRVFKAVRLGLVGGRCSVSAGPRPRSGGDRAPPSRQSVGLKIRLGERTSHLSASTTAPAVISAPPRIVFAVRASP